MAQGIYDLLQETLKLTTNLNKQLCCEPTPPSTTTTTTTFIPPGGILVTVLIGYQTISPVEDIVLSNTSEDTCIFVNNILNANINFESGIIFDQTTYYYVSSTDTLYNLVTNSIAEDGYYYTSSGGFIQVINGLVQVVNDNDLFELCNIPIPSTSLTLMSSSFIPTDVFIDNNKILKLK
jgi:hypothetical protein